MTHPRYDFHQPAEDFDYVEALQSDDPVYLEIVRLRQRVAELEAALADARSGLNYIRECHGELYGVGFNRVEKAAAALLDNKTTKE